MPSLLRRSIPMLARIVWSWMWRNVRYLLHPNMPVHWMSSGQRKTKSVPSKHLAPGWPETEWLCMDQNTCIRKVRLVFFAFESIGLFSVNPPTSRDLCETYVLPVLLYSCEHWVINHQLIEKLESFLIDTCFVYYVYLKVGKVVYFSKLWFPWDSSVVKYVQKIRFGPRKQVL